MLPIVTVVIFGICAKVVPERGSEAGAGEVLRFEKKKLFFCQASYFAIISPVARNGCAQRVYHVDGIGKSVQPIEKSPTERCKPYF